MRSFPWPVLLAMTFLCFIPAQAEITDTEITGVTAELLELRQADGVLRLLIKFINTTDLEASARGPAIEYQSVTLIDSKSRKKHFPMRDADGRYLAGPTSDWNEGGRWWFKLPPKGECLMWVYFDPIAAGSIVTVEVPKVFPFEDVEVTGNPASLLPPKTRQSLPAGLVASLVSARRSQGELKVRLKLENPNGASIGGAPIVYEDTYFLDPATKRKYPLLKDAEGNYLARPMSDQSDGGRLWLSEVKSSAPALMSLTFQAPPDTVAAGDLVLPRFQPFEAVTIEGLGGAATGGVAASGKTVGLEGALKDLNAEVTPKEISIDLSADVLFDFDKSDLKPAAEEKLQQLLTVVQSRPNAMVLVEGHTDTRGEAAYNQALSLRRAEAVKNWLLKTGVPADRVKASGAGETRPLRNGQSESDHQANRRVAIRIRER